MMALVCLVVSCLAWGAFVYAFYVHVRSLKGWKQSLIALFIGQLACSMLSVRGIWDEYGVWAAAVFAGIMAMVPFAFLFIGHLITRRRERNTAATSR